MRLKTVLIVVLISVIGVVFTSFFAGQVLLTQTLTPFSSLVTDESVKNANLGDILDTVYITPLSGSDKSVTFVNSDFVKGWIPWVIKQASILIGGLSLIVFVYAGVSLIINGDNDEELTKSVKMLIFGIVGIALAGFSYSIVANVLSFF